MENVLFLQSDVKDPYSRYAAMMEKDPVYYDSDNKIWAVYCYRDCLTLLEDNTAQIPSVNSCFDHEELNMIIQNFARLSNSPTHDPLRKAALHLMGKWQPVSIGTLLHLLLGEPRKPLFIDWVDEIGKKLPALALLKGMGFSTKDIEIILPELEYLNQLMAPAKIQHQCDQIGVSVDKIKGICHKAIAELFDLKTNAERNIYFSNMLGLLIQSYDAGRGLLSNTLLQVIGLGGANSDVNYFYNVTKETLRFDPPVQNTRRAFSRDLKLGHSTIQAGESVLIVLASANRDQRQFDRPDVFLPDRNNNDSMLTFGYGMHQCVAKHFVLQLTANTLQYIFNKYKNIELQEREINYEPRVNVRLPIRINVILS